jgi:hypothetical protein
MDHLCRAAETVACKNENQLVDFVEKNKIVIVEMMGKKNSQSFRIGN